MLRSCLQEGLEGLDFTWKLILIWILPWIHCVVNSCHIRMILDLTPKYGDDLGLKFPYGPLFLVLLISLGGLFEF